MNYTKQEFKSGEKLYAAQLNAMDEQIAANAAAVEKTVAFESQTLTDEQKAQARDNIAAAPMSLFKISDEESEEVLNRILTDESVFTAGKYCNPDHGRIVDLPSYRCTEDYIEFPSNARLMVHYSENTTKERYPIAIYYDENKVYISGEYGHKLTQEDYNGKLCAFYNIPENTRFIRFSLADAYFNHYDSIFVYIVTEESKNGGVEIPNLIVPLTAIENYNALFGSGLPLYGKTIVNFGDSIFGNARPPKDISTMLANITGATVKNCAFGGCRMAVHTGHWDAFSMYRLASAVANNDYSLQDEALNYDDRVSYAEEPLALIKETDFSKVDIVTIAYGTNDWSGNNVLDNADNLYDTATVCGALRYSVETLLTAFPQIRIFVLLPTYRFWMDDEGAFTEGSETKTNNHGKTLGEYSQAIRDVAESYNLPVIDNYRELGMNKLNRTQYFPANDGTHHNENGRKVIAAHLAKKLW